MRTIDADALLETSDVFIVHTKEYGSIEVISVDAVGDAPTVDVVPVVRCRECIAYTPVDDNTGKCVFLIGKHQYVVPDGYCYLGERKEGANGWMSISSGSMQ